MSSLRPTEFPAVIGTDFDPCCIYFRSPSEAFFIARNPVSQPRPGEEPWPMSNIDKYDGVEVVEKLIIQTDEEMAQMEQEEPDGEPYYTLHYNKEVFERCEADIKRYGENYTRPTHQVK